MTIEEYTKLLRDQNGVCAICLSSPKHRALDVDHSHQTGNIRGLLCSVCNLAIGYFKDSPALLFRAIGYLTKAAL